MGCKYYYNGLKKTYDELIKIVESDIQAIHDLMYSLDNNMQNRVIDTLTKIKEDNKARFRRIQTEYITTNDYVNGSAELQPPPGNYSTQSFIDSGLFVNKKGEQIIPPLAVNDFLLKAEFVYKLQGLSNSEVAVKLKNIEANWKKIARDCKDFHKIILSIYPEIPTKDLLSMLDDTSFETLGGLIKTGTFSSNTTVYNEIIKQVSKTNRKYSREIGDNSTIKILKNITISADLINRPEKVFAHIDFVAVQPDGSLDIFLIKGSHESPAFWDRAKREKYLYELALLTRILEYNGIDTTNARLNIIPATFTYDSNYEKISNIQVHNSECYSHNNGAFVMLNAIKLASLFFESRVAPTIVDNALLEEVDKLLVAFIPEGNVKALGVVASVKEYIKRNYKYWLQCELPESGYNLLIDGEIYSITDNAKITENEEVFRLIELLHNDVAGTPSGVLHAKTLINTIKKNRRAGGFPNLGSGKLDDFFRKYFEHTEVIIEDETKYNYTWEIVENDNITACNIIIFKNKSGQIDIIDISSIDPDLKHRLNGRENILGYHLTDLQALDFEGNEILSSTYGHIEVMRTLFLLNALLPLLGTNIKLGNISVIGGLGKNSIKTINFPIELIQGTFNRAINILNNLNLNIKNNISNYEKISASDIFIDTFWLIMLQSPGLSETQFKELKDIISGSELDGMQHLIDGTVISSLTTAENTEIKIARLEELIKKIKIVFKNKYSNYSTSVDSLIRYTKSPNEELRAYAKLLIEASITLDRLTGNIRLVDHEIGAILGTITRPLDMSNSLIRLVSKLLTDAIHKTAFRLDELVSDVVLLCLEFYKAKGYTQLENYIIGSQTKVFKNLFQDIDDELIFKNPYDPLATLDDVEREFLKKILLHFNKVRFGESILGQDLREFIKKHPEYLWAPLEKASSNNANYKKLTNAKLYATQFGRRIKNYCSNPMDYFREGYEKLLDVNLRELLDADMRDMQAYNPFRASEVKEGRLRLLRKGKSYFESNVEELLIDYIHRSIQEEEMNNMLVKTKGILLHLKLEGVSIGDPERFKEVTEKIDEYIKVSVYNKSIIKSQQLQNVAAVIKPIRKAVTASYIALNPKGFFRDTMGGFLSNIVRTATKFRTDVDVSDILWAYLFVLRKGSFSTMNIDLLDKLNSKFIIHNINIESQQEGYKTGRLGVLGTNWLYWCLKKPDFLNRMVLFIAKLKHDGSVGAYSVKDGLLHYDWKLDKRFSLLASNNKTDIDAYNKQASLYLSLLLAYNEEHPDKLLKISLSTDLPEGYTMNLIETIKLLADTIYGAYSTSLKAWYELTFIGLQFAVFSTWMNGIWDVYFGKRRTSSFETIKRQQRDNQGRLLYFDNDGNITTEVTDKPYLTDVPLIVLGVMYTLLDIGQILLFRDNKWEAFKKEILLDYVLKRNLKRLFSDLLIWLIMHNLFKFIFDPAYEEHKKMDSGKKVVTNILTEWLYHGAAASFEEFKGPFPVIDYVTNNTKPAAFLWSLKFMRDTYRMISGEYTIPKYLINMQALPRSVQDSYQMYMRDSVQGRAVEE